MSANAQASGAYPPSPTEPINETRPPRATRPGRNIAGTESHWYRPNPQIPVAEEYPRFQPQVPAWADRPLFGSGPEARGPRPSPAEPLFEAVYPYRSRRWGRSSRPAADTGVVQQPTGLLAQPAPGLSDLDWSPPPAWGGPPPPHSNTYPQQRAPGATEYPYSAGGDPYDHHGFGASDPLPLRPTNFERPPNAPERLGGDDAPLGPSWYRPAGRRPAAASRLPVFRPDNSPPPFIPMPADPTVVQLPPVFDSLMEILRENRLAQLASVDQQRELIRYMRGLNEWLERDVHDRQAELREIVARLDQLRDEMRDNPSGSQQDANTMERIQELETELHRLREHRESLSELYKLKASTSPPSPSSVKTESWDVIPPLSLPDPRPLSTGSIRSTGAAAGQRIRPPLPLHPDDDQMSIPASMVPRSHDLGEGHEEQHLEYPIVPQLPSTGGIEETTDAVAARLSTSAASGPSVVSAVSDSAMPTSSESRSVTDLPSLLGFGLPAPVTSSRASSSYYRTIQAVALIAASIVFDSVPRQVYLHLLLRIPSLYFSRVARVFEDAQLSLPDIKRMARATADQWNSKDVHLFSVQQEWTTLPRSLLNFRSSWENFIDSLMREWKTLNIISVLLLSAILTLLQIDAAANPITRTSALFSLICALMSLLYGCMYIIRFGTMRKMHKASSFADEAQKQTTNIWWNVWVLLAMPAIWLSWSIIMFFMCIMSMIWLSGSVDDPLGFTVSSRGALGPRIGLTVVFSLGLVYFALIMKTFHRYGDPLDREWMRKVKEWTKEGSIRALYGNMPHLSPRRPLSPLRPSDYKPPVIPLPAHSPTHEGEPGFIKIRPSPPLTALPSAFLEPLNNYEPRPFPPLNPIRMMKLGQPGTEARMTGHLMGQHPIQAQDWDRFVLDISSAWNGQLALTRREPSTSEMDLPAYTIISPRPENPTPPSAALDDQFDNNARMRSGASSDTSYGLFKPVIHSKSGFVAPERATEEAAGAISEGFVSTRHSPPPPNSHVQGSGQLPNTIPAPLNAVREFIDLWNQQYFWRRHLEASLVPLPDSSEFAVNFASRPLGDTDAGPGGGDIHDTASIGTNTTESNELHRPYMAYIEEETEHRDSQ